MWRFLLLSGLAVLTAEAVEFDRVFSPHMVLQREAPLVLRGRATPGAEVSVGFGSAGRTVRAGDDGAWQAEFPPQPAGGPHVLHASEGSASVTLEDVWCGDVWVCSGQSNMQMGVKEAVGGPAALAAAGTHPDLRLVTVPRGAAAEAQRTFTAKWTAADAESLAEFSAVAWFFALHLKQDAALAGVPVGLVNSSFGGTAIEAWTPLDKLPAMAEEERSASMFGIPAGGLYNGMIAPLTGLPVKGVLWYQGEANAGRPGVYAKLLDNLVRQWRGAWRQAELPFFIVQLPAFEGRMGDLDFSWLREAQAAACRASKRTWLAQTFDTTDGHDLHPVEKEEIGRRLALLARREVYGAALVATGPELRSITPDGPRMRVHFDAPDGLVTRDGKAPAGFELAAADGEYRFARAEIDGPTVVVECPEVPKPESVRYAWGAMPTGNLAGRGGLPAAPFRSDSQPPRSIAFQLMPAARRVESPFYQLTTGEYGQVGSLLVRGRQFLSNDRPAGAWIPDGFGPRTFPKAEQSGPGRLRMSDPTGSLEIACDDRSMEWILENGRDSVMDFHIGLSPRVTAKAVEGAAELSRDGVTLRVEGAAIEGEGLSAKVPPHGRTVVRLRVEP